jgi:hypothetical protein
MTTFDTDPNNQTVAPGLTLFDLIPAAPTVVLPGVDPPNFLPPAVFGS